MEKVYIVLELYIFDSVSDTKVSVYSTREKALEAFKLIVEREKKDSWIGNNSEYLIESEEEDIYNVYYDGRASEYETTICVEEKEIW